MRIYRQHTDQEAVKFPYRDGAPARYRVFPNYRYRLNGIRRNTLQEEVAFDTIEDAAHFLRRHEGSAIRMMPGRAIVCRNVVIDDDGVEPEESGEVPEFDPLEEEV